jgi:hypothetical protein
MGDCSDGSLNGAQFERGRLIYECRDGNIVAKACVADDLTQVNVGSTTDKKHYRLRCSLNGNELSLEPIACLHKEAEHKIDETFEDGTNFFTCKRDGDKLRVVNQGCLNGAQRINLNEKIVKDDLVLLCNSTVNNGARLMPSGCAKDGKQYNVGDSFEIGKFWFNCTRTGSEKVKAKPAGCVANGKRLNDGDRYQDNDVFYECVIDADKQEIRVTACAQHDSHGGVVERKLGCTWNEGQDPISYQYRCLYDQAANTAKKVQLRCNYKVGDGVYEIEPNQSRVIDDATFTCEQNGDSLNLVKSENTKQTPSRSS